MNAEATGCCDPLRVGCGACAFLAATGAGVRSALRAT